jgi:hypothetical protein
MFNFLSLLILLLALLFITTYAQEIPNFITDPPIPSSWDLSAPIIRPNGRILITNRNLGGPDVPMVDFHIGGLDGPASYLEFQASELDGKDVFMLIGYQGMPIVADEVLLPGRGEFRAIWAGQGTEALVSHSSIPCWN